MGLYSLCTYEGGCNRLRDSRGLCRGHVQQFRRGMPLTDLPPYTNTCSTDECYRPAEKDKCLLHSRKDYRTNVERLIKAAPVVEVIRYWMASDPVESEEVGKRRVDSPTVISRGNSLTLLSLRSGISYQAIGKLMRGEQRSCRMETADRLITAMDMNEAWQFELADC